MVRQKQKREEGEDKEKTWTDVRLKRIDGTAPTSTQDAAAAVQLPPPSPSWQEDGSNATAAGGFS